MFNDEMNYAGQRISGTAMFHKPLEQLVVIQEVVPDGGSNKLSKASILHMHYDQEGNRVRGASNISDFRFETGKLGYTNFEGGFKYVSRRPLRRDWRQGLRSSQLLFVREHNGGPVGETWFQKNLNNLSHTINGLFFKDIKKTVSNIEETGVGRAISRSFAVSSRYALMYKGCKVGKVNSRDLFELEINNNFLAEELAAVVGEKHLAQ